MIKAVKKEKICINLRIIKHLTKANLFKTYD